MFFCFYPFSSVLSLLISFVYFLYTLRALFLVSLLLFIYNFCLSIKKKKKKKKTNKRENKIFFISKLQLSNGLHCMDLGVDDKCGLCRGV